MIYLGGLFIKWGIAYPTSALVCDIVFGIVFVAGIIYIWKET